ncbi:MAG: ABC transporter ATP-binding protein [Candidatus Lokiarchaeota archaeon]|nr:ABC transporter ATP-binding protein [Candidatus Lokiarchaeota archaeon]
MSKTSYIKFQDITKCYKNTVALDNLSLDINKGEIFGYIGPNGAGKTTTIKILVGLITEFQGEIFIDNIPLINAKKKLHEKLGYLPQEVGFQEWRTINHALKTFGKLSGIDSNSLEERIRYSLKLLGLSDVRNKKIKHLSGGMIQKLRLSQAILNNPKILVLDEPLSGLDPSSRYQVKNMIKELAKKEVTILFSSHILSDVEDFATKIGIINKGRILKIGSPKDFQKDYDIGKIIEIEYAKSISSLPNFNNLDCIENIENFVNKQRIQIKVDSNLDFSISKILKVIIENQLNIRHFNLIRPSLEDIYIKLVEEDDIK